MLFNKRHNFNKGIGKIKSLERLINFLDVYKQDSSNPASRKKLLANHEAEAA